MTSIYVLCDPHTRAVRYVGQSKLPLAVRLNAHMGDKHGPCPREAWIRELSDRGVRPRIELLEQVDDDKALKVERWWINFFVEAGSPLVNSLARKGHTSEARRKMAESRRGKPIPPETRAKISAALKGRRPYVMTDVIRKRFSEVRLGVKRPTPMAEEARRRIAESKRGRKLIGGRFVYPDTLFPVK